MPGFQGRKHHWDFVVSNNSVDYPFICYRPKGVPSWDEARQPDVAGQYQSAQSKPRAYRSTHSGFGWGQFLVDNVYHYCTNLDSRFPQQIIMGPLVSTVTLSSTDSTNGVTGIFEYGTSLYTISGKWVNKINPTTDAVAATGGFPYDLTTGNAGAIGTVGVRFDANIVIGVTTASTANMVSFDGTSTFTVLSGANVPKGAYLARYYEDSDWRLATVFLFSSSPSAAWIAQLAPLNTGANWAGYDGDYGVGDQGGTLTGLTALERTLYVGMSDGLYFVDRSGRAPVLIPAMPVDSGNGKNLLATAEGLVWYPCKSGLYLYDPNSGTIDNVAPGRGLPDRSGIAGTYTAIANFRAWTFVSVYDGTDSYIMAGRQREEGEPGFGPYIWHGALAKISSTEVKSMHVSALVSPPRLWMGLKSGNVAYIKLPGNGDNPLNDSTCFLEETSIWSMSEIRGASRRWYEGEVIEITTAGGHKLTGTPNHPILTSAGWEALGLLAEGDDVICCGRAEEVRLADDNPHNVDTPIGQVFRLLQVVGTSVKTAGTNNQFHGDGQESNVDIVFPNSLLLDGMQASFSEPINQGGLTTSNLNQGCLLSQGETMGRLSRTLLTTYSGMASCEHCSLFIQCHFSKTHEVGISATSDVHTFTDEDFTQGAGGNPDRFCDSFTRFPISISADQLGEIICKRFASEDISFMTSAQHDACLNKAHTQKLRVSADRLSNRKQRLPLINIAANKVADVIGHSLANQISVRTAVTDRDVSLHELTAQNPVANTDGFSNDGQPLTVHISRDKIIKVDRRHFYGHVYNLQTNNQWYIANNIIAHNCRYAASGSLYFGADDYGVGGMRWQLSDIILEAEGLSANTTVQVWERRDLGTWTSLQTITSSGRTVITTTTDKRFQRIEKRLDIVNNDSTTTPVVRVLTGNAIPRPSMRDVITATVLLDRETLSKLGMGTRKSAQDFLTEIDTWDNGAPVTLKYSWGGAEVSKTAIVISVHKRVIQQEGDEPAVYVADLVFRIQG